MWENEVKHTCIESTKPDAERFFLIIRTNEFIWTKKINYAPAHVPFVHMMMGAAVLLVPPFVDHGSVRSFEYCCIVSDMLCLFNIHFSFDILLNGIYLSYNYKGETVFFIPWRDNIYIRIYIYKDFQTTGGWLASSVEIRFFSCPVIIFRTYRNEEMIRSSSN